MQCNASHLINLWFTTFTVHQDYEVAFQCYYKVIQTVRPIFITDSLLK